MLLPSLFTVFVNDPIQDLNKTVVCFYSGDALVSHLSYAGDMVLLVPNTKALQRLFSIYFDYPRLDVILCNTGKRVCMISPPKDIRRQFSTPVPYLGHGIISDLSDDKEIPKLMGNIYAVSDTLTRKFTSCTDEIKIQMLTFTAVLVEAVLEWPITSGATMPLGIHTFCKQSD
ncbi:uncharacterized protein LOC122257589 [Penaeus japonicus]|uniref:uncharacterized protein LOC122257589 n=1 Tax=Penaeus japonicus TaxID=27405 RepID=UPI001C710034|nr:uncharacterized protein LOC122257589 [Penaeus japonicus]